MTTTTLNAASSTGPTGISSGDDGTLTIKTGATAGSQVNALTFAADGTPTFLKTPSITTPNTVSMVRLNTGNGLGSTSTAIRRFANIVTSQGSDISYNSGTEATLGAVFTINTNGVYAISYTDVCNATNTGNVCISLNSANLTTTSISIPISEVLSSAGGNANTATVAQWTGYLPSGSVIRPHTQLAVGSSPANGVHFTITRVA